MKFLSVYLSFCVSFLFNLCINAFGPTKVKTIRRTANGMMKSISGFFGSKAETLGSQFKSTSEPSTGKATVGSRGQWESLFYRSISATFDTVAVMLAPLPSKNDFVDSNTSSNSVESKAKDMDYVIAGFMDYDPKSAAFAAHGKATAGNKKSALSSDDVGTMFSSSPSATWFVRDL